jgi:broad specificity phosphatase PhoE
MLNPTTLHLVRHGDVYNPHGTYYGRLPRYRLSDLGRWQAENAGIFLAQHPIAAIYASPMLRARQTADIINQQIRVTRHQSKLINEAHTPHDGISRSELIARDFNLYTGSPPEFEQPADIVARVSRFCEQVKRRYAGKQVVAVTHGDVVVFSLMWAKGAELTHANRKYMPAWGVTDDYPANCCILTLTLDTDQKMPSDASYFNPHGVTKS